MATYKTGDLVKLRSSGPVMTIKTTDLVAAMSPLGMEPMYWCQWFVGKKLNQGQFAEDSLERADEEPTNGE